MPSLRAVPGWNSIEASENVKIAVDEQASEHQQRCPWDARKTLGPATRGA
jgi:hypothetical protein